MESTRGTSNEAHVEPDEEALVRVFYGRAEVMISRAHLRAYRLVEDGPIDRETVFAIAEAGKLAREARDATRH